MSLFSFKDYGREISLLLACVLAVLIFWTLSPQFATADNFLRVLRNSYELWIIALAMMLVMSIAAIDISLGVGMGVCAYFVGTLLLGGQPLALVLVIGPLAGMVVGAAAGAIVVLGRVPAIVGTLGLLGLLRMAIYLLLGGDWLSGIPGDLTMILYQPILGPPLAFWVIGLLYVMTWIGMRHTSWGTHLLAIGHDEDKARLQGLPVQRLRMIVHITAGSLAGVAAIVYIATYRNLAMTVGSSIALEAVAAAILGGTSILGGKVSILGTALAVLLLRILQNGLLMAGLPSLWQPVVTGAVLLAVLAAEASSERGQRFLRRRIAA
jgi:AI-2 transport system permease protein